MMANRYEELIEAVFFDRYNDGDVKVAFERSDIESAARNLGIDLPKNIGDVVYSFRYRSELPHRIAETAPEGRIWIIKGAGRAKYMFVAVEPVEIHPNELLVETKVPDATPGLITKYAFSDEQALLAILRYNRLIDVFTGVTCYSLQNHFRTTVKGVGQVETDEVYIGVDKRGAHYVLPVQAKGGTDKSSIVQIEQDFDMCAEKLPGLVCRPIAAQFMDDRLIALFAFENGDAGARIVSERHYRLVSPDELTDEELAEYRGRPME